MSAPRWMEIEIEPDGDDLRVKGSGSRGERPAPHTPGEALTRDRLDVFTRKVGRAIQAGRALGDAVIAEARELHAAIFRGDVRDLEARLVEASGNGGLLQRLFVHDGALQAVPWEALCRPDGAEDFWGTSPRSLLARGVRSVDPWEPREIRGAVRLLAIAPSSDERALRNLEDALADSIAAGEIEWLDPIVGAEASSRHLFEQLRRSKNPHVIHFLGHGSVDARDRPVLQLAPDASGDDDEPTWITAEALARELAASFGDDLRLVFLEACEGAKPGAFASAAEILARAGADAVVAYLWPVRSDVARVCSHNFYHALTAADQSSGDVVASLAAARRTLLLDSAEGFSPVLYLRGSGPVIFRFKDRRVEAPGRRKTRATGGKRMAPALQALLEERFSLILGDRHSAADDKGPLRTALEEYLADTESGDMTGLPLSALAARCELRHGQDTLHDLFQDAFFDELDTPVPPLLSALGRFVGPGVHATLLWLPRLEHAVAEHQPDRTIYSIQPPLFGGVGRPRVIRRAAGALAWNKERTLPDSFDLDREIFILRLYGGYLPEKRPIFTSAMLSEDDHIHGLVGVEGFRPPEWASELMGRLRVQPALFVGLSVLKWRHRMLLHWLYDQRPAPRGSLALAHTGFDPAELEIWQQGGGLPGAGRIAALCEDADALTAMLEAFEPEER